MALSKCNKSAKKFHQLFSEYLAKYSVKEELKSAVQYDLEFYIQELTKENLEHETICREQLREVEKSINTIEEKFYVKETMTEEAYTKFKARYAEERAHILQELEKCAVPISNLLNSLQNVVDLSVKLNTA